MRALGSPYKEYRAGGQGSTAKIAMRIDAIAPADKPVEGVGAAVEEAVGLLVEVGRVMEKDDVDAEVEDELVAIKSSAW